jgi:hypothetical protein
MVKVYTSAPKSKVWQGYQRRTPEQRREVLRRNGVAPIDPAWLARLLNKAYRCTTLTDWELGFCLDFDRRLAEQGKRLPVSDKQLGILRKIEAKIKRWEGA